MQPTYRPSAIDLHVATNAKAIDLASVYGADALLAANAGLSLARAFDDHALVAEWTEIATILRRITVA